MTEIVEPTTEPVAPSIVEPMLGAALGQALTDYEEAQQAASEVHLDNVRAASVAFKEAMKVPHATYMDAVCDSSRSIAEQAGAVDAYNKACAEHDVPRQEAYQASHRAYSAAINAALAAVTDAAVRTEDALVVWIMNNAYPANREAALKVLSWLPATMAQLDHLADDEDWCEEWDRQVSNAITDGVIPSTVIRDRIDRSEDEDWN